MVFGIIIVVIIIAVVTSVSNEEKIRNSYKKEISKLCREKNILENKNSSCNQEIKILKKTLNEASGVIQSLSKYQDIADLKQEEKRIKEKIKEKQQKADDLLESAIKYYHETVYKANQDADRIKSQLDEKLQDAVKSIEKWQYLENKIEGYEKFFIPEFSIFDELSQRYSFSETGMMLDSARKRTKYLIENNLVINSDFQDEKINKIFSSFYLNCFENKLELLLSKIKATSLTIIEEQIRDCFTEINSLCSMFNYRVEITTDYLEARLDEFRWIYRLNDFIQKRKEEDAARREEAREKLKAQKEIEKAILKKQKEIEKAELELKEKSEFIKTLKDDSPEKEKMLSKIRELESKIKELSETQARTKSMQELGYKAGVVYVIGNKGAYGEDIYKIGVTQRYDDISCCFAPQKRVDELFSSGVPFPFEVHAFIETEDAYNLEKTLHNKFCLQRLNKVNKYKEFFNVSLSEIKEFLTEQGLNVNWTLESEISQWEATKRINKQIKEDVAFRENFIKEWEKKIFYNEEEEEK